MLIESLETARYRLANAKGNVYLRRAGLEEIGDVDELLAICRKHETAVATLERLLAEGMPSPDAATFGLHVLNGG